MDLLKRVDECLGPECLGSGLVRPKFGRAARKEAQQVGHGLGTKPCSHERHCEPCSVALLATLLATLLAAACIEKHPTRLVDTTEPDCSYCNVHVALDITVLLQPRSSTLTAASACALGVHLS